MAATSEPAAAPAVADAAKSVRIGTRKSQLAMWQANYVADLLRQRTDKEIIVDGMNTMGDIDLVSPLTKFTAKGVFTKELDEALFNNRIDAAVHCMKDLPTILPEGLEICAVLERGDTEDALVLNPKHAGKTLATLPEGAVIGTSALRRIAVLGQKFPHLVCKDIRGNVNSRIAKLDSGDYDGLILARVGLERLSKGDRIAEILDAKSYGYAVGQGALAIVCREHDLAMHQAFAPLDHMPTAIACQAERALLRTLEGGCKVPITVRTTITPLDNSASPVAEAAAASPTLADPGKTSESTVVVAADAEAASTVSAPPPPVTNHGAQWCELRMESIVLSVDGQQVKTASVCERIQLFLAPPPPPTSADFPEASPTTAAPVLDAAAAALDLEAPVSRIRSDAFLAASRAGDKLAQDLLSAGAAAILSAIKQTGPGHVAPSRSAAAAAAAGGASQDEKDNSAAAAAGVESASASASAGESESSAPVEPPLSPASAFAALQ